VDSLDLHIKHGRGIDVETPQILEINGERTFLLEFDVQPTRLQETLRFSMSFLCHIMCRRVIV
jgi:hypothetical protein